VIKILTGDDEWEWIDENDDKLKPSGIYSKNEFKKLLNDFRSDTPAFFIETFKNCVQFNWFKRPLFSWVSYNFNFFSLNF
jgi:hypothetical protein